MNKKLHGAEEIRRYLRRNELPISFIGPTAFNALGMDRVVKNFRFVSHFDSFDGRQPNVFSPRKSAPAHPRALEAESSGNKVVDCSNALLRHPEVGEHIRALAKNPAALFLMFDARTESSCRELGLQIWFPEARLRDALDDKIETVRLGNAAGVPSAPNCLAQVEDYEHLMRLADAHELGRDLIVQTAFGDSGHTTFFIATEPDWDRHSAVLARAGEVKIMKRINCHAVTQEACITRAGILVGPLLAELIGFPELTPERGGWCGNQIPPPGMSPAILETAGRYTVRLGEALKRRGYRGYFDVDYLLDRDRAELYLGELNPRLSGATPLTTFAALARDDIPLLAFHLLEYSDVDFELDVEAFNARSRELDAENVWASLIVKKTHANARALESAPCSGIWSMKEGGAITLDRFDHDCHSLGGSQEAFVMRVAKAGDTPSVGDDLFRMILRAGCLTPDLRLDDRARSWVEAIRSRFV